MRALAILWGTALVGCGGSGSGLPADAGHDAAPIGRLCDLGTATSPDETVVASPSLDCATRVCVQVPLGRELPAGSSYPPSGNGLCSAQCETEADCERVPDSPCTTGFACGVVITVGPFCCQTFCVCKDYVVVPDGGQLPVPAACDPTNANNTCCNLPGRC